MRRQVSAVLGLLGAAAALSAVGCSDDSCKTDLDCPTGRICRLGLCALDPAVAGDLGGDALVDVSLDCPPAEPGDLVLNEILADPGGLDINGDGTADSKGDEFVEIVNVSGRRVGILNAAIRVQTSSAHDFNLGARCLDPWEARVFFGTEASLGLTNSGGTVSLLVNGQVSQSHTYGDEANHDESITLSPQLDPNGQWARHSEVGVGPASPGKCANGNDFPDCTGSGQPDGDQDASGDGGGAEVISCDAPGPQLGDLLLNEVMADPGTLDPNQDGLPNNDDEYLEIVNLSNHTIDLDGMEYHDGTGLKFTFPKTCVAPNQAVVLFGAYTGGGDFGAAIVLGAGKSLSLNNSGDLALLRSADGTVLDSLTYGSEGGDDQSLVRETDMLPTASFVKHSEAPLSGGAPMSPGRCQNGNDFPDCAASPTPDEGPDAGDVADGDDTAGDAPTSDASDAGPWDDTSTDAAGGDVIGDATDAGTSDATDDVAADADATGSDTTPACGLPPASKELVINEILANPDGNDINGDGTYSATQDEFLELVNVTSDTLDLSGVTVLTGTPATTVVHTFPQGTCLAAKEAIVLFGPCKDPCSLVIDPTSAIVFAADKSLSLNNGGDSVAIHDALGAPVDTATYTSATESWVRDPEGSGDFVKHSTVPAANGAKWSPGTCVDGGVFMSCIP